MRWDDVSVELPDSGVVIVTGANGHGKSTLIEAVAQAAWGQSVRGTPGWRADTKSGVRLQTPNADVLRTATAKGATRLKWTTDDDGAGNYPTKSKAQAKLEETIGTFSVWTRACVFSSHEAGRFTTATDKHRKELLEELLDLERFAIGYKRATTDRSAAVKAHADLGRDLAVAQQKHAGLARQLSQAQEAQGELAGADDLEALRSQVKEVAATAAALREQVNDATTTLKNALAVTAAAHEKQRSALQIQTRYENIKGFCPACEQEVEDDHLDDLLDEARSLVAVTDREHGAATRAQAKLEDAYSLLSAELRNTESEYATLVQRGRSLKEEVERRKVWDARVDGLGTEVSAASDEVAALTSQLKVSSVDLEEIRAACSVLGLQGVRAGILSNALESIQALANEWLAQLGLEGLRVQLGSQSASKTGNISDKISFEVEGAGGGYGYKASSGGERRRIDIAVMLALADVAVGEGIGADSTLFVDELFDALDATGVDATVEVLDEISQQRCVVVISHNRDLVDRLPNAVHFHVSDGMVDRVRG